ncbi:hypothetical protein ThimaDRAFT_1814 [Thiocapsa marina 5811]|uniref:Uncharacterized protein n=1 Tax=Thiocapsa marina 5811 TaxID=768671 RepID=F9UA62_9GAMM|nr:hypothetical protein ThimaDRAFT_1814 [Thiocapsa marina 5811]
MRVLSPENPRHDHSNPRGDRIGERAAAYDDKGYQLPAITGFRFAWYAFHPQTEIFTAMRRRCPCTKVCPTAQPNRLP